MTSGIYKIINKTNNKTYIGSSINIERRWNAHKSSLRNGTHHSIHLQNAWDKYGEECFIFEIIAVVEQDDITHTEQYYIDLYKSSDSNHGYNIAPNANSSLGIIHSDEFKKRCSENTKKRYEDPIEREKTGKKSKESWTDTRRQELSDKMKEKWSDPNFKDRQSKLTSDGAKKSEAVSKRSSRMKKIWENLDNRKKACLAAPHKKRIQHVETGKIYESICEACRELPVSKQTIKNSLSGRFKSRKGMNFIYVIGEVIDV